MQHSPAGFEGTAQPSAAGVSSDKDSPEDHMRATSPATQPAAEHRALQGLRHTAFQESITHGCAGAARI